MSSPRMRQCLLDSCAQWVPEAEFEEHMVSHFSSPSPPPPSPPPSASTAPDVEMQRCLLDSCGAWVPKVYFVAHMADHFLATPGRPPAEATAVNEGTSGLPERPGEAAVASAVPTQAIAQCPYRSLGCTWSGPEAAVSHHAQNVCRFRPGSAANEAGEGPNNTPPAARSTGGGSAPTPSRAQGSPTYATCFVQNCNKRVPTAVLASHIADHRASGEAPPLTPKEAFAPQSAVAEPLVPCLMGYCRRMMPASELEAHVQCHLAEEEATLNCPSCMLDYPVAEMYTFNCKGNHRFCRDLCVARILEMAEKDGTRVTCPICHEPIHADEIAVILGKDHPFVKKYETLELKQLLESAPDTFLQCPTPNCIGIVEVPGYLAASRHRVKCKYCERDYCSLCRASPFHYNTTCREANWVRANWATLSIALGNMKGDAEGYVEEQRKKLEQYNQLRRDEANKAQTCVLCPRCKRVVYRTGGCPSMVCGQDYHGGNIQNGCGHQFNWYAAQKTHPYVAQFPDPPKPKDDMIAELCSTYRHEACYPCCFCGSQIVGVRFECLNCPDSSSVCLKCIGNVFTQHPTDHSFIVRLRDEEIGTKPEPEVVDVPPGYPREEHDSQFTRFVHALIRGLFGR